MFQNPRSCGILPQTSALPNLSPLLPPSPSFPWPTAPVNLRRLYAYRDRCVAARIGYKLGGKARDPASFIPDFRAIDCSGWVRAAVAVSTSGRLLMPDGSMNQHDWADYHKLKVSNRAALLLPDGLLRLAFLVPSETHPIGHVFLCRNSRTLESWGGHGPGSRSVLSVISEGILQQCASAVYVLALNTRRPQTLGPDQ